MEIYLLKSALCLAIFFAFYKLFLERENMHTFKRFYLLGVLIASFGIPLITFTKYVEAEIATTPIVILEDGTEIFTEVQTQINYLPFILWGLYGLGFLFFAFRFGKNLYGMIQKIRKNPKYKQRNLFHVLLQSAESPHTFFSYIFLNKEALHANEIPREVLDHEEVHARQLHSFDVLFIEIIHLVFWFNPLIYFIKDSIKLNHEFLADRAVINQGVETSNYQNLLLAFSSNASTPALANSINYSSFKKRFNVMKSNTSNRSMWLRTFVLVPLLALLIYGFSSTQIEELPVSETSNQEVDYATQYLAGAARNNVKAFVLMVSLNEISLNGKPSTLSSFAKDLDAITKDWEETDYTSDKNSILVASTSPEFIKRLNVELAKTHYSKANEGYQISIGGTNYKATPEQIAEYNKLAGKYNAMPKDRMIVKKKELSRMKYLYDLMTPQQRENAQPFPQLPPPPPPPPAPPGIDADGMIISSIMAPNKNIKETLKKYNAKGADFYYNNKNVGYKEFLKDLEELDGFTIYKKEDKQGKVGIYLTDELGNVPPPPPPAKKIIKGVNDHGDNLPPLPPAPPAPPIPEDPLDHIISMAKKGATFYYEGKNISSDKAIELIKNNRKLNIQSSGHNSKNPKVKLSTSPIEIKNSKTGTSNTPSINIKTENLSLQTGNVKVNGEELFYTTKNGVTSYFNGNGESVDHTGKKLASTPSNPTTFYLNGAKISSTKAHKLLRNNRSLQVTNKELANGESAVILTDLNTYNPNQQSQDPFIDLTEVISQNASFYFNDKLITTAKAQELVKLPNKIERVSVKNKNNGNPLVYLWGKS